MKKTWASDLQETWDISGKEDPLWAMLSHPDKKGNRWKIEEFFRNGEIEIKSIMEHIRTMREDNRFLDIIFL